MVGLEGRGRNSARAPAADAAEEVGVDPEAAAAAVAAAEAAVAAAKAAAEAAAAEAKAAAEAQAAADKAAKSADLRRPLAVVGASSRRVLAVVGGRSAEPECADDPPRSHALTARPCLPPPTSHRPPTAPVPLALAFTRRPP